MNDYIIRLKTQGIWACFVYDKGLTQVAPDSLTCLVIEPLEESMCDELFGDLKLL
jgi:peptidyl-tRNA hydrolase